MPNHLAGETSPYLLQHVNNPVDWYPWGDEALSLSRTLDRPIFLSIGYSACHWCHVMEHESFEDADIARVMNEHFVCIKVDREERPDLDQIYMNAVQAMTGSGGWPMSVFLTPDRKPFYGGTYWPPTARWGRPGFREILIGVNEAWQNRRRAVNDQAEEMTSHLCAMASASETTAELSEATLQRAGQLLVRAADQVNGGFGSAPKFPHPMDLRFALRCWKRFQGKAESTSLAQQSLDVVLLTLDKMARGGIYDHLGGGFARYSTDQRWLVPHFEKMLYDNAQLVPAYLEAYQITGREEFADVVRETLDYVLREMTQPEGGFYSTQDADSEGVEGKFFVWEEAEVDRILAETGDATVNASGRSISELFKKCYDVTAQGNWEHTNILNRPKTWDQLSNELRLDAAELQSITRQCREQLFAVRSQRVWPGRDDKVLVSWNGLMIVGLSMAAEVLQEPRYAEAARAAAEFILNRMTEPDEGRSAIGTTRLLHCYKDGQARFNAYLDDYGALIDGLCELYQVVSETRYLDAAVSLAERMVDQFWDKSSGGFYYTSLDHETLITRNLETYDNATPSGNSLAALGLLKLSRLTGRLDFEAKATATLEMMSGQLERNPLASGMALMALDFLIGPAWEIVVAEAPGDAVDSETTTVEAGSRVSQPSTILNAIHKKFVPNKVIHRRPAALADDQLPTSVRPTLQGKVSQSGRSTMYVCQRGVCERPIVDDAERSAAIERL